MVGKEDEDKPFLLGETVTFQGLLLVSMEVIVTIVVVSWWLFHLFWGRILHLEKYRGYIIP